MLVILLIAVLLKSLLEPHTLSSFELKRLLHSELALILASRRTVIEQLDDLTDRSARFRLHLKRRDVVNDSVSLRSRLKVQAMLFEYALVDLAFLS